MIIEETPKAVLEIARKIPEWNSKALEQEVFDEQYNYMLDCLKAKWIPVS